MNLEIKTSVVRERIHFRPCKMGTKVNVRTCRDDITLTITETQIDKHHENSEQPTLRQNSLSFC